MMPRAIECYEMIGAWEQLLNSLNRCKDQFKEEERQSLVNKYVPVALNSLYKMLTEQADLDDTNKGQMQERVIMQKYAKGVAMIDEEDEDEYGDQIDSDLSEDESKFADEEEAQEDQEH